MNWLAFDVLMRTKTLMIKSLRYLPIIFLTAFMLFAYAHGLSESKTPPISSQPAQSAYDFINSIGVNTHLNYFDRTYGDFALVEHELRSLGVRHLRDGIHLQNDDYNKAVYGRWLELGSAGIRFDAVLDPRSNLGPLSGPLLDKVNMLAGGTIESFEGPNELDISNMKDWPLIDRNYQPTVFSSVRAMTSAKSVKTVGPSLASAKNGLQLGDVTASIDYGNLHPYPAAKMPSSVLFEQTHLASEVSGNKEIVITETGYHNALNDHSDQPAVSEQAAAKYIPRLFLENFAAGIYRTYLYEFLDEAPDPGLKNFQLHWGLIRADGTEKPVFIAMKNLISELSDTSRPDHLQKLGWNLSNSVPSIHHLLLQKSNGEFDLVLWQEVSSYDEKNQRDIPVTPEQVTLTLEEKPRSLRLYEPTVQAQPFNIYTDKKTITLEIPDHPLVIQITPR